MALKNPLTAAKERWDGWSVGDRTSDGWRSLPPAVRVVAGLALVGFLFLLPVLKLPILNTPGSDFASVLFYPVGIYVLMALGLNVVVGYAGLLDLGYVAFFAVGGYFMALLGTKAGLTFIEILPLGIAASMLAGVLLGIPTLRLRGDYLAIVTLGFGEIIRIAANNSKFVGQNIGISNIPHPSDIHIAGRRVHFGVLDPKPYYWILLALIILVIYVVRRLERSRVGRAWTAIREDEDAAELMGVPTYRFKIWAFAMGAGIAGMGGVVFASKVGFINPDNYPFYLSIIFLAAVVLGGAGNIPGVILGAVLVAYLPERFRPFQDKRILIFGAVLVVMMIFRPQGIWPSKRREAELTEPDIHGGAGDLPLGGELPAELESEPVDE
ncbi:MAG: branched-chain amino acid ABC transporter permease [Acidimicrobiales bacterium]